MAASLETTGRSVGQLVHDASRGGRPTLHCALSGIMPRVPQQYFELRAAPCLCTRHLDKNSGCQEGQRYPGDDILVAGPLGGGPARLTNRGQ